MASAGFGLANGINESAAQDRGTSRSVGQPMHNGNGPAAGMTDRDAAYAAARTVEERDIADLTAARDGLAAPDVIAVFDHLLTGSQHHLSAFGC